ncbi:trypsin-like peptidase domain-containing protein [Chloroflexi bacterium TSY]|nr:trypsin-like peptidase domain-containing protein [Chloroflexi bacterium TSY]
MSINLSQSDFRQLTRIVQNLPDFANVRDRRRLIAGAVEGASRDDILLARLDLDGPPMGVAVEVVRLLARFGQVAYGKEALGVFLNYIHPFTDDEDAAFIDTLFATYPLDAPAAPSRTIDRWRGTDRPADVQEKIIGENTLRHIYLLQQALSAAEAVVHLHVTHDDGSEALGTGFLVAPDLLMTNNHVVATASSAGKTLYNFNYQLDVNGQEQEVTTIGGLAEGLFHTNAELDYTVLQLANLQPTTTLTLQAVQAPRDSRVSIIQHPGGHLKQISMQNNFVAYADRQVVQYTTSTLPGSSGSPVFNDDFSVIAIHHSGGLLSEPGTNRSVLRNAGSSRIAVLNDLKNNAPDIYVRLKRG